MTKFESALYQCQVHHTRLSPRRHSFSYGVYMFYLDLKELTLLEQSSSLFNHNSFNVFGFYDSDHLKGYGDGPLISRFESFIRSRGIEQKIVRVKLLTYPRLLGYVFNPVSFYFGFDKDDRAVVAVAEVSNTFGEMKAYLLDRIDENAFALKVPKNFYVSPFGKLTDCFDFVVPVPGPRLKIGVDTVDARDNSRVLVSSIAGERFEFNDLRLMQYFLQYPLVTLKVITMIHVQALLLYLKRVPYFKKEEAPELQSEILNVEKVR